MITLQSPGRQQGAITILIAMIMLVVITVMITTAFSLSTINLKAVGNAQVREEALAAAQIVIEQTVASPFALDPNAAAVTDLPIDIYNGPIDGDEYLVTLATPLCVRATQAAVSTASSVTLPGMTSVSAYNTIWELDATATEGTTGAKVRVIQGVRILLSETERNAVCN
ncbi:MAG: hypothetical protein IMF06_14865 [Proteobacteria bacterium]|nr:hypothetical protein [Pseudomonadota bacterium]